VLSICSDGRPWLTSEHSYPRPFVKKTRGAAVVDVDVTLAGILEDAEADIERLAGGEEWVHRRRGLGRGLSTSQKIHEFFT